MMVFTVLFSNCSQKQQSSLIDGLRATNEVLQMPDHHITEDKSKESSLDRDSETDHKVGSSQLRDYDSPVSHVFLIFIYECFVGV